MRWAWIACLLLASVLPISAEDWTTEDGHVYHDVTVLGQEDDGVRITYDGGVGKVPYYELPVDIQKRFGQDVDSLATKRQAVDKAIADAVHSAATADVMLPAAPVVVPAQVPSVAPSGPSSENPTPGGGTATTAPGTTAPGTTAPGVTAPGATAPGNPSATTTAKPGQAPGTATNTAAGAHNPAAGAHPAAPGSPAGGQAVELPSLEEPVSHAPVPTGMTGAGGKPLQLSVANYIYNESLDICYLDSPPIDVYTPNSKTPPGQGSSLTLRIVTDGRTPQVPDRFEMTFVAVGGAGGDLALSDIHFTTDTGEITLADSDRKDSGSLPGGAQAMRYVSFYLSADDVKKFSSAKAQTFSVGQDIYHLDARGAQILHDYMSDVGALQPATSSLMRSFYKMLARIPPFFSIISTICEYIILGSFGLLVAFSIAAFILGISRFIKM